MSGMETAFIDSLAAAQHALVPYLRRSRDGDGPARVPPPIAEVTGTLDLRRWIRDGGMGPAELATFLDDYLDRTTRIHHPYSLAHQVAVPSVPAAIADLVHGITNNPMAIYE